MAKVATSTGKAPPRHLDVAGGTGDIAFRSIKEMANYYQQNTIFQDKNKPLLEDSNRQIVVCDINPEMLEVGRQRSPQILGANLSNLVSKSLIYSAQCKHCLNLYEQMDF